MPEKAFSVCIKDSVFIDPCMGSGHILVYAFDVLMQIYEASGYSQRDAAQSILENNLFGLDIDDRAAQLAYFAVMMKARQYDRRIFSRGIQPHVYAIVESNGLDSSSVEYFTNNDPQLKKDFGTLMDELRDAKEYGSILNISQVDFASLYGRVEEVRADISMFRESVLNSILPLVKCAEVLAQKYDVVATNPPYLGSSRFSAKLNDYVVANYPDIKADLSMVMYKHALRDMCKKNGFVSFITTTSWMFLSSFEKLRSFVFAGYDFVSLIDFGTELFDGKVGHNPIVAWVNRKSHTDYAMTGIRLVDYCYSRRDEKEPEFFNKRNYHYPKQSNFSKIPGSPVAYWASEHFVQIFEGAMLYDVAQVQEGLKTGDNDRFIRFWNEVDFKKTLMSGNSNAKWIYHTKGGDYKKWYGNQECVLNFQNDGEELRAYKGSSLTGYQNYGKANISYSRITSAKTAFRYTAEGAIPNMAGLAIYTSDDLIFYILGWLNTEIACDILSLTNPTINFPPGTIGRLPILIEDSVKSEVSSISKDCVEQAKQDWDSFETSWDFKRNPLVNGNRLIAAYAAWRQECEDRFRQLQKNEEELNRIFIDIYGLQDELTPDVADKDVTVHRVFDRKDDVPESMKGSNYVRTMRDEIVSLISYAVGCMFGRYSLDVDGLAYAGGEWDESRYKTIVPDSDNIIPICDDEYFDDDITGRFVEFVRKVYGDDTLEENLKFVADALGGKGTPREVIRSYFLNDFYADHLKIYQKRPIYWLFDSGKKNGFKALIYMHRYQSDLLARMRTDYVHEQQERYRTQLHHLTDAIEHAGAAERVKLTKQQKKLQEQALEIQKYEEKIHHLADQNIQIDLDDGVKHNYELFADVLAKIK